MVERTVALRISRFHTVYTHSCAFSLTGSFSRIQVNLQKTQTDDIPIETHLDDIANRFLPRVRVLLNEIEVLGVTPAGRRIIEHIVVRGLAGGVGLRHNKTVLGSKMSRDQRNNAPQVYAACEVFVRIHAHGFSDRCSASSCQRRRPTPQQNGACIKNVSRSANNASQVYAAREVFVRIHAHVLATIAVRHLAGGVGLHHSKRCLNRKRLELAKHFTKLMLLVKCYSSPNSCTRCLADGVGIHHSKKALGSKKSYKTSSEQLFTQVYAAYEVLVLARSRAHVLASPQPAVGIFEHIVVRARDGGVGLWYTTAVGSSRDSKNLPCDGAAAFNGGTHHRTRIGTARLVRTLLDSHRPRTLGLVNMNW